MTKRTLYAMNICEAVITAAVKQCLSVEGGATRQPVRKVMRGWNEYVKPFQDESWFWFGVWKAADCPAQGELYNIQRNTKMQYKYAVRRLKHTSNSIQQQKFIDGLITGGKDIFL